MWEIIGAGAGGAVLTAAITAWAGRGKAKADTAGSLVATAQQLMADLRTEREECRRENAELTSEVRALKAEVKSLSQKIDHLDEERRILLGRLAELNPEDLK